MDVVRFPTMGYASPGDEARHMSTGTRLGIAAVLVAALIVVVLVAGGTFGGGDPVPVVGLSGSEKIPFFEDDRVQAVLRDRGFEVEARSAGSREIATSYDLTLYDFAFPAGVPAATKIRAENSTEGQFSTFFTPMVIASWDPIADLLAASGVARDAGTYHVVDLRGLVDLMAGTESAEPKVWTELPGNEAGAIFNSSRSVLINSTDIRKSNSAAMYLSMVSYALNGGAILTSTAEADAIYDRVEPLFLGQGFAASSSAGPFETYLVRGMGGSPMVMVYEAQFIEEFTKESSAITNDMTLLYPEPTLFTQHTFVALTEAGREVGELLSSDPELQRLAAEYGLRTTDRAAFEGWIAENQVPVAADLQDVIDPPSYEVLEHLIQRLEEAYQR
jgi:hypothetical protein